MKSSLDFCCPPWLSHWGHRNARHLCVRPSITKLVGAITSDFINRFTQYLTQCCIPPLPWMSLKMNDLDLPLTYFSRSQCKILLA